MLTSLAAAGLIGGAALAQQSGQATEPAAAEAIGVETSEDYGQYLADGDGRAVYMLEADQQGEGEAEQAVSACDDACAEVWPPVLTGTMPIDAEGPVQSDLLSTIERQDGSTQVTYNGWPLYYYARDAGAGAATGQDVHDEWGEWYLLQPDGEKVEED